jgi:hypothetical protein
VKRSLWVVVLDFDNARTMGQPDSMEIFKSGHCPLRIRPLEVKPGQYADPQRTREARVRAFLNVALFNAVYEKYKGGVLPPTAAFERDIQGLGVAEKMKDRARRALEKSAEFAGFFEQGKTRLIRPGVPIREATESQRGDEVRNDAVTEMKNGDGGFGDHDPLILGLFRKLPEPETEWPTTGRLKWLQTAANIFDLLYKGDGGGIVVSTARADRSPRPHDD